MLLQKGAFWSLSTMKPSVHLCVLSANCQSKAALVAPLVSCIETTGAAFKVFTSKSSPHPLSPHRHPPPPLLSTLEWCGEIAAWRETRFFVIVMRPSRGQRCQQQYDSQRRSANWSPSLKSPPPTSLSAFSHTLRLSSPSECTQALRLAFHPSFLLLYKTLVHKGTLPCLELCAVAKTETAAGCEELITPRRHSVCEILK